MINKITNGELHLETTKAFDCQVGDFLKISREKWYDQYSEDDPKYGIKKRRFDNEDSLYYMFQFKNFRFRFTKNANYDTAKFYLYESKRWGDEDYDLSPTDAMQLCDELSKRFDCYVNIKYFTRDAQHIIHENTCRFYKGNYIKPKTRPKMDPTTGATDFLLIDGMPFANAKTEYALSKI